MSSAVPQVKVSHYAHSHGTGGPHGKQHALYPVYGHGMGSQLFINLIVHACVKFFQLLLRDLIGKAVGIPDLRLRSVVVGHPERIGRHRLSRHQSSEKPFFVRHLHGIGACAHFHFYTLSRGNKRLDQHASVHRVGAQQIFRMTGLRINHFLYPGPVH